MTKVWEENWALGFDHEEGHETGQVVIPDHPFGFVGDFSEFGVGATTPVGLQPIERSRARLACAAPDMARELLAIEWSALVDLGDALEPACPRCRAMHHNGQGKHAPGCSLDAALEKAGLRMPESSRRHDAGSHSSMTNRIDAAAVTSLGGETWAGVVQPSPEVVAMLRPEHALNAAGQERRRGGHVVHWVDGWRAAWTIDGPLRATKSDAERDLIEGRKAAGNP